MKIGVFDSGVGGKSVANAIFKALPNLDILVREDKKNIPYGTKTNKELYGFVLPILHEMEAAGCKVIVIACNTVTTTIIKKLRRNISVTLIGMEPMLKPAILQSQSRVIGVFATPRTLESARYAWLKNTYAQRAIVLEPDCSDWANMIESNTVNVGKIRTTVSNMIESKADTLVLGCTHYHWIESLIREIAGEDVTVLQPEQPIIKRLNEILKTTT